MINAAASIGFQREVCFSNNLLNSQNVNINALRMTDGLRPVIKAYPHSMQIMLMLSSQRLTCSSHSGLRHPPRVNIQTTMPHTMPVCNPLTASTCMAPEAEKARCTSLSNSSR